MKIEIKLENPDYCNGCPCANIVGGGYWQCGLYKNFYKKRKTTYDDAQEHKGLKTLPRPEKCKEENGL